MQRVSLVSMLAALVALLGCASAGAHAGSSAGGFVAKGDAICAKAIRDSKAAGRLYTFANPAATFKATVSKGASWVAIDNATAKALAALKPSSSDDPMGDWKVALTKHQQATAELLKAIASARAGRKQAFVNHFTRSSTLGGGFGLRAWSLNLKSCQNWTP
jgi:hypothetical protein